MVSVDFDIPVAVLTHCTHIASIRIDSEATDLVWSRSLELICGQIRHYYRLALNEDCEVLTEARAIGRAELEIPMRVRFQFPTQEEAERFRQSVKSWDSSASS